MTAMTDDLVAQRNEALRKIGRNVVLFQQLEGILKFLASIQHPSTPVSRAALAQARRADSIRSQSLGQVAGRVVEQLYSQHEPSSAPDGIVESWLTISFRLDGDAASIEEERKTLKALIAERNGLVHHLLSRWNLNDVESCCALSIELDEQRVRLVREIERYSVYKNAVHEMARELKAFIESDEGKQQFELAFLQQSRLCALLVSIATECARADGWAQLSTAGHRLRELVPDQFAELKKLHGDGSLQKLVAAIGLFDISSEFTPAGGTRTLYRLRVE